ncbi:helix-turn-helix transcriptional regulator [Listeria grandensis]|uniref:Helix-turn-helix transcriptional regulator n=1 Tax=Listeria grandensis TaxID=1494963 RepID=A0A7X1CNT1_9LIST|nr:helix-turn-helix transcriptional regulator [Listeria grandensis]MBC1935231.1 helix-turn-helix transcriptional regulator [Listeria grandensis]
MRTWLLNMRIANDLTQEQVALASGIKRSYYTMIELGERTPSVSVAQKIASTLNFEWSIFFEN